MTKKRIKRDFKRLYLYAQSIKKKMLKDNEG